MPVPSNMHIKIIVSIIGLLLPWFPAPVRAQAVQPPPFSPFPIFKQIEPLPEVSYQPVSRLELAGFHFDPMGTHPNTYAPRNCTWGAASMEPAIPQSWGNANTWDDSARAAGVQVSDVPVPGAVAQTDRGGYGHVAVVTAVAPAGQAEITEMNYDGNGGVRTRLAAPGEFVFIYI